MNVFCLSNVIICKLFHLVVTDNCGRRTPAWIKEEKKKHVIWIMDQFRLIMMNTSSTETFVMDYAKSVISAVEITNRTTHIVFC